MNDTTRIEFGILPYLCAGPIYFNMTREEVQRALNSIPRLTKKRASGLTYAVAYDEFDLHVHFDNDGLCEFIEFWRDSNPTIFGQPLIGRSESEAIQLLKSLDPDIGDVDQTTSIRLGIGVWIADSVNGIGVASVGVFRRGYYVKILNDN